MMKEIACVHKLLMYLSCKVKMGKVIQTPHNLMLIPVIPFWLIVGLKYYNFSKHLEIVNVSAPKMLIPMGVIIVSELFLAMYIRMLVFTFL